MSQRVSLEFEGRRKNCAEDRAQHIADDDAEQNGCRGKDSLCEVLQQNDGDQDGHAHQKVDRISEILVVVASAEGIDADADEGKTDGRHNSTGDYRRKEFPQGLQAEAEDRLKQSAHQSGAEDRAVGDHSPSHGSVDAVHDADKAGAGSHDNGKPSADGADGPELDQGHQARDQHGVLDHRDHQPQIPESAGPADHQDRRQVSDEHGQHMLHTEKESFSEGDPSFQFIFRSIAVCLFFVVLHFSDLLCTA